ncbi:hypothetical protein LUX32_25060 [Actinomadura madurae]|nr:hypothetical protein [Actinomadura madurae]MCP9980510.1 hypothetical protein [Actinomadura madurae]
MASTVACGQVASTRSASALTSSITCSQLSSTSSGRPRRSRSNTARSTDWVASVTSSASATACPTAPALATVRTGTRSTKAPPGGEPGRRLLGDGGHQPGLAHPARADHGHQPRRVQRRLDRGDVRGTPDEGRPAGGQPEESPGTGLLRPRGQGVPVGGIELAQQRRDVALDRPDRDAQPAGDLRVRQVLAHGGEHLGLPCRDLRRVHIDQDGVRR